MNFTGSIERYWAKDGLLGAVPSKDKLTTNNGILLTALFYILKKRLGEDKESDKEAVLHVFNAHAVEGHVGLYYKSKMSPDLMASHDDLIGLCAVGLLYNQELARRVYAYGSAFGWNFNVFKPRSFGLRRWHGRFPGVVQHYKHCAGLELDLLDRLLWLTMVITKCLFSKGESGLQLAFIMVEVHKDSSYLIHKFGTYLFWRTIKKKFGSMKKLFSNYHGKDHPFATYTNF